MLDARLVPTPLGDPQTRRVVEVRPPADPPRFRQVLLVRRFLRFGLALGWRRLRGPVTALELGTSLRQLFESLGGLWIKLGQLVAMRRDLLPGDFCRELGRLQDRATGFPGALARRLIEEDLGRSIQSVFSEFEDQPFAAASIGQLHRARLVSRGHVVAVKVRRPNVAAAIEADLRFVRRVCRLLDVVRVLRDAHLGDFLTELTLALREELDYRLEASSIERMRRSLEPHGLYVPRVFSRLCSARVLTMEFVDGVLMSEFIAMRDQDPERVERWLAANKIKPGKVGRLLHQSLMRQIVEDNLFHGDLHPGNIVLLRKSHVALIDFGSIGSLEARFRTLYRMLNRALSDLEFEKVADIMSLIAPSPDPGIDWDVVRRNASLALRRAELRAYAPNLTYQERSLTTALLDVARSLAGSGFPIGWAFMRVDRAHVTLDASLTYLLPDVAYLTLGQEYWTEARSRAFGPELRGKLVDGLRRARTVSGAGEVAEGIDRVGESVRAGASSFR
ncbi:MAG TPA: AarF/ABC1/UbiB kinase family protein, partial [Vicinamibacteria bacterium]|nr:AarF/ABC1/UbiB kinase family protein [Vicinamibacteria bacterium]